MQQREIFSVQLDQDVPVEMRDGTVLRVRASDTIVCPPGEEHWHGAAADTFMSHLAVVEELPGGGYPTTWLEPVAEEDYRTANER